MAQKSRHIEVSSVALVDLKAEISRRQVEVKQRVEKHPDGCNVIRGQSDGNTNNRPSFWRNPKECLKRDFKKLNSDPDPTDAKEYAEWERSKRSLEAKAKLYEALKAAALSGKNVDTLKLPDYKDDGDILVDFQKKVHEEDTLGDDFSSHSSDEDNCPPKYKSGDDAINSEDDDDDDDDGCDAYPKSKKICPSNFTKECNNENTTSNPDDLLTYAHLRQGEIRDHGVGFYAFSKDAEERELEMNRLRELHRATEEGRMRTQAIRVKRDIKMGQRLAKLRARKGLPDVATAAAQYLGDESTPSTPFPISADAQSDIRLSNDDLDVASMLRRLRDEAEKRAANSESTSQRTEPDQSNVPETQHRTLADLAEFYSGAATNPGVTRREWDKGKSMISAQRYVQMERDKRVNEFAPPSRY